MINKVYLLLGSNLNNPSENLREAIKKIKQQVGRVCRSSSVYETAAWGNEDQPAFLNQAILVKTKLEATEVLQTILLIEQQMGRLRTVKNAARKIDIDIIFFNKQVIQSGLLTIPHPFMQERNFVLFPLGEIAPHFIHPVLQNSVKKLGQRCSDKLAVKKI